MPSSLSRISGNNNVVAYRISPTGAFIWGADGIALSNSTAFNASPKVCATAAGNAVFAWQADDVIIMQKVSPSGSLMWGSSGITLSGTATFSWPQLLPVGADDVILKYFEDTGPSYSPTRHVYAQRYNGSGNPVWSSPAVISNAAGISAWTQIFPFINDGSDGFYIAWHDDRDNNMLSSSYVQHIGSNGAVLFPANGVEASTMGGRNHFYPHLALPTGSQEVLVFWNEMSGDQNQRGLYGQKLSSTGTRLWGNTGMIFIEISSTNVYPLAARQSPTDAVLFYEEYTTATAGYLKAMRIDASGGYVWTPQVKTICSVNSEKVHTVVNDFANNQWIVSWEDDRSADKDIYAQNIQLNGDLGPYDPQEGTVTGNVTLVGGTASVTLVNVSAGNVVTQPASNGNYSMTVPAGTWNVIGSLPGYIPDTVFGVVVIDNQTTSGVNLTLTALPTGFISGNVTLNGGQGNITEVEVTAGYHSTSPDANGNYSMEVEIGTFDVMATLPGYYPDTNFNVTVIEDLTTTGVNFTLDFIPITGFITGYVELEDNAGDVTQVDVMAGTTLAHPDENGIYVMEVMAGTYDVSASLPGFLTQVQPGIVVQVGMTTVGVDFFLYLAPDVGYIEGTVTLINGTGDVTETVIEAVGSLTNPNASGHYFMALPAGTYSVHATHPRTEPDSIAGIVIEAGMTVSNVDFELEIVRSDMVCIAIDDFGNLLNNIDVEMTGPEGTYEGTIVNDSLVFTNLPYGYYIGTATWPGVGPVNQTAVLSGSNHHMIFEFLTIGIENPETEESGLACFPNPFRDQTGIEIRSEMPEMARAEVLTLQGFRIRSLETGASAPGMARFEWNGRDEAGNPAPAGLYMIRVSTKDKTLTRMIMKI